MSIVGITTDRAASALGITRRRVQKLIDLGLLPATKYGRDWLIDPDDIAARLKQQPRPGRPVTLPAEKRRKKKLPEL